MRRSVVLKLTLGAVIPIGLAWLFLRTVRQTLAEPYVISGAELSVWTLVADEPDRTAFAQLALRARRAPGAGAVPADLSADDGVTERAGAARDAGRAAG